MKCYINARFQFYEKNAARGTDLKFSEMIDFLRFLIYLEGKNSKLFNINHF